MHCGRQSESENANDLFAGVETKPSNLPVGFPSRTRCRFIIPRLGDTSTRLAPPRTSRNQRLVLLSQRYEERDFREQILEVAIAENGTAVMTGFPILGSHAI